MIIIDDMILAIVVVLMVLLAAVVVVPAACFFGILIGGAKFLNKTGGGREKTLDTFADTEKSIEKLKSLPFVSHERTNVQIDPIQKSVDMYLKQSATPRATLEKAATPDDLARQDKYLKMARAIYKKEGKDPTIFKDVKEYSSLISVDAIEQLSTREHISSHERLIVPENSTIRNLVTERLATKDYPESKHNIISNYGLTCIEYFPHNKKEFEQVLDKIFEYAVLSSIRELKPTEEKDLVELISSFESGKLTEKKMILNFKHAAPQTVYDCSVHQIKHPYSTTYKKLHWGQRKLLLSEIDFFNRTAKDMGYENFKKQKISVVYPGAAHGHKLMIQMEMFPNIIYYLWDPAKYNTVLYIADFIRRKLDINFKHTDHEMEIAKKFVGRVFINMELPNDIYLKYHNNSTTGHISDNYGPEYGFFVQKSADYYLNYKKDAGDDSPTLFISDIRLFTNADAGNSLAFNFIKDYENLIALHVSNEIIRNNDYVRDMQLQRDWFAMTKASYGLFKFKMNSKRFTKYEAQYEYLTGDIVLQAWARVASTETRLFVSPRTIGGGATTKKPAVAPKSSASKHTKKKVRFADQESVESSSAHQKATVSYYNIDQYTDKLHTFNTVMRPAYLGYIRLSDLGMDFKDSNRYTIKDVWREFLPPYLMGMDAILETMILYDYLSFNKPHDEIKHTDIMLMISDMTQTLINHSDYSDILGYLNNDNDNAAEIIRKRKRYHDSFKKRLDYNLGRSDRNICEIRRENYEHKSQH
jgi:hypothetical protein